MYAKVLCTVVMSYNVLWESCDVLHIYEAFCFFIEYFIDTWYLPKKIDHAAWIKRLHFLYILFALSSTSFFSAILASSHKFLNYEYVELALFSSAAFYLSACPLPICLLPYAMISFLNSRALFNWLGRKKSKRPGMYLECFIVQNFKVVQENITIVLRSSKLLLLLAERITLKCWLFLIEGNYYSKGFIRDYCVCYIKNRLYVCNMVSINNTGQVHYIIIGE